MNNLQFFNFENQTVRTVEIDSKPCFIASEVLPAIVNKGDYMTSGMIERLIKYLEELWERSNWNDWQKRYPNIQFWK